MSRSTDQRSQPSTAEPTVEVRTDYAGRPLEDAQGRPKPGRGIHLPSRPIQTAAQEVKHLEELERAGESEWTPWIAIAGLILFFAAVGLLMFGIIEGTSQLFLSVEPSFS